MNVSGIFKKINVAEFIIGFLCILYWFLCIVSVGSGVSILYIWIIIGILLILKAVIAKFLWKRKWGKRLSYSMDIVIIAIFLSVVMFAGFVTRGMHEEAKSGCDYLIVLGAGVNGTRPSEILQKRIDAAYKYLKENPGTKVIGTGGQGVGEDISEGKCIANELEAAGIAADRILYEGKSTTTVENIKFAMEKIPDQAKQIVVVSNGFHISRSKLILSNYTDAKIYGIAATGGGLLTPHYVVREYIVFLIDIAMGNYSI